MTEPGHIPRHDLEADHLVETPETLRDSDPEAPPLDRGLDADERPAGAERFGTTHAEEAEGQDLDHRVAEEEPDVDAHDPIDDVVADHPETFGSRTSQADEPEALGEDVSADDLDVEVAGEDHPAAVGRLVEPDEGVREDTEKDEVADDRGQDADDWSAEEAAMHLEPE
jgi:uncharacterized protein DUF5709